MKPIDELSDSEWLNLVAQAAALRGAPSSAVRAALELWRDHASRGAPAIGTRVRRWVAALTFDSWALSPEEMGVRGAVGEVRHLLYAAAGYDIDLRIVPMVSGFDVNGQYLGREARCVVRWRPIGALASDAPTRVELTPSGEFCIAGVGSGTYVLELELGDEHITLAPVTLGTRDGGP